MTGSGTLLAERPFEGIERLSCSSERTTLVRYRFEPQATFPFHSHEEEQLTVVLEGEVVVTLEGEEPRRLAADEWMAIPPSLPHGMSAGDDGALLLAALSPARRQTDAYTVLDG